MMTILVKGLIGFLAGCALLFGAMIVIYGLYRNSSPPRELAWLLWSPILSTVAATMLWPSNRVPVEWRTSEAVASFAFVSLFVLLAYLFAIPFVSLLFALDNLP